MVNERNISFSAYRRLRSPTLHQRSVRGSSSGADSAVRRIASTSIWCAPVKRATTSGVRGEQLEENNGGDNYVSRGLSRHLAAGKHRVPENGRGQIAPNGARRPRKFRHQVRANVVRRRFEIAPVFPNNVYDATHTHTSRVHALRTFVLVRPTAEFGRSIITRRIRFVPDRICCIRRFTYSFPRPPPPPSSVRRNTKSAPRLIVARRRRSLLPVVAGAIFCRAARSVRPAIAFGPKLSEIDFAKKLRSGYASPHAAPSRQCSPPNPCPNTSGRSKPLRYCPYTAAVIYPPALFTALHRRTVGVWNDPGCRTPRAKGPSDRYE